MPVNRLMEILYSKVGYSFMIKILGVSFSYLFLIFSSRLFGAEVIGLYSVVFVLLQMTSLISRLGVEISALKLISKTKDYSYKSEIHITSLVIVVISSVFMSVFFFFCSDWIIHNLFPSTDFTHYKYVILYGIIFMNVRFLNAEVLRALDRSISYSFIQYLSIYLFAFLGLVICYFFMFEIKPIYLFNSLLASVVVTMLLSFLLVQINFKGFMKRVSIIRAKEVLLLSKSFFFASSFAVLISWTDILMCGIYLSKEDVGVYTVSVKMALFLTFIVLALSAVYLPTFSKLWEDKSIKEMKNLRIKIFRIIFSVNTGFFILLFFFAKEFLMIFGEEFVVGAQTLRVLLVGVYISSLFSGSEMLLQMADGHELYMKITSMVFFLNLGLNYLFIHNYGIIGAAFATSLSLIIWKLSISYVVGYKYQI